MIDLFDCVQKGVLYLDGDSSMPFKEFDEYEYQWMDWECQIIEKIVIGKNCGMLPVEQLAYHRQKEYNPVYSVEIDEENPFYVYRDGAIFSKDMYRLIFFVDKTRKTYTIPNGVAKICEGAFQLCPNLHTVIIPDGVTEIGGSAFAGCKALQTVMISSSVTEIAYCAFEECENLRELVVPNSVCEIGAGAFDGVPHILYNGSAVDVNHHKWGALELN